MRNIYGYLIFFLLLCSNLTNLASSPPDLTIVGFFEPEDGIGKVAINILETLGPQISANLICSGKNFSYLSTDVATPSAFATLSNTNKEPGKVALLTDLIWDLERNPADQIPKNSFIKLAYSMLESTEIPKMWVTILNEKFDAVVVPDKYLVKVYQESGVVIPIFILPIPMVLSSYLSRPPHSHLLSKPFIFGDASANKNPKILIKAFAKAFRKNPDVQLYMRACQIKHLNKIERMIKKYGLTNVTIDQGKISLNEYLARLETYNCFINLSKGEGFSFIPRECLALGIPVIITNNTASTTICESGFVRAVPSLKKMPCTKYFVLFGERCGKQFDCEVADAVKAMQDVYKNYTTYCQKALQGREWVKQYDVNNPRLQNLYRTLIKPYNVILGDQNLITEETLITNSNNLYQKYIQLINY